MLFNSYTFIILFLPLTVVLFYAIKQHLGQVPALALLVTASGIFYGWWNPSYLLLLAASIGTNYGLGKLLVHRKRRAILIAGVAFNLALLGYFKYADFFVTTMNALVGSEWVLLGVVLPLAISFFTFQQIAFLVNTFRGTVIPGSLLEYMAFVAFFPQLIAGPIVNYRRVMSQFARLPKGIPWHDIARGLTLFSIGLFKKVVLADNIAPYADAVFGTVQVGGDIAMLDAWGGSLAYTLQLYLDFSGYSDMALGLGHLFGIRLPINFDVPYKATSIADFWRRWHITLSSFLRDYLYIPLGGNRRGFTRTQLNVMITFLLGGLWHGAGWTFVVWGALHGFFVVTQNLWERITAKRALPTLRPLSWVLTFLSVVVAWVVFRSESLAASFAIWSSMIGFSTEPTASTFTVPVLAAMLGILGIIVLLPSPVRWVREETKAAGWRPHPLYAGVIVLILLASATQFAKVAPFLYFNF